jgi:hypothetical protein
MTGLLGTARQGLDVIRYRKSPEGKAEAKARRLHNQRMGPKDKKTRRKLRADAKKADAAKGALMKARGGTFKGIF